ncbi:gliding motility-associated C-terminal domain-containing protein [Mesonia maritima]
MNDIPIGDSESNQITLQIPATIPDNFTLSMSVNIDANGDPILTEIDPTNNFDDLSVQLLDLEIASPLQDLEVCDDLSNDGFAKFDLSINESLAIGNQSNVSVTFYQEQNDAEFDLDPITNPENYQNSTVPEIIWLKLSSTIDPDCYLLESFKLDIFYTPVAVNPPDIELCNENPEELNASFNLTDNSSIIQDNQPNTQLRFFTTENDALNNQNSISFVSNYQNNTSPETIFVRLENENHPECFTITDFQILVNDVDILEIEGLLNCDEGFNSAYFNLSEIEENLNLNSSEEIIGYYTSLQDAFVDENSINNPSNFKNESDPQQIFIRIDNLTSDKCYRVISFPVSVENCPPFIPEGFSPNGDGVNDTFEISGLYDIFENFNLKIYSRYGNLIYEANNNIPAWDGTSNKGIGNQGKPLPTGTYYYILDLNDPNYKIYKSWVYLQR